jgi:hypothetical protein
MLPPYKRPKPRPFVPPRAIRRLPLNLKRDGLYPRQPGRVGAAVQEYYRYMAGAQMPHYLPQRMAFSQWKSPRWGGVGNDGVFSAQSADPGRTSNWLRPTESWAALMSNYTYGVPNRVARIVEPAPRYNQHQAVAERRLNTLPQPVGRMTPVVARQVRQNDPTARMRGRAEPPPSAWANADEITQHRHRQHRLLQQEAALFGARAAVVRARGFARLR